MNGFTSTAPVAAAAIVQPPAPPWPAATLVDVLGTAALVTTSDSGGVSLALTTHYLRPAPTGSLVLVDAQVGLQLTYRCRVGVGLMVPAHVVSRRCREVPLDRRQQHRQPQHWTARLHSHDCTVACPALFWMQVIERQQATQGQLRGSSICFCPDVCRWSKQAAASSPWM
jgi:acyl-coenzyme A thioesterase PaaI-like protein